MYTVSTLESSNCYWYFKYLLIRVKTKITILNTNVRIFYLQNMTMLYGHESKIVLI